MFKRHRLKNLKNIFQFLLHFCNLHLNLQLHSLNISVVINSRRCGYLNAESSCFETPLVSQCVHGRQTLLKLARQHFHPNFPLIKEKMSSKTSLPLWCEILGLFGKTLTADHMYSRHDWETFQQHVQTPLCQKHWTFSGIFYWIFARYIKFSLFF